MNTLRVYIRIHGTLKIDFGQVKHFKLNKVKLSTIGWTVDEDLKVRSLYIYIVKDNTLQFGILRSSKSTTKSKIDNFTFFELFEKNCNKI